MNPLPRISRHHDPASSVAAEVEINLSGQRQRHIDKVIAAVNRYPGSTGKELAHRLGMDSVEVSRRLADARDMDVPKVVNGQNMRQCLISGRASLVWYPV